MNLFNFLFRGVNSICGRQAKLRRSREQCKLVCKFPRREQYMWPSGQIAQKPRAMQTRLQIALRRSREQCKLVCKLPRREPYMWPTCQIAQKPRAMQTRLQIAEAYFTLSAKTEESGRNSHCVTRPYSAARQMDSILDLHRARFGWFFAAGGNYMGRSQIYIVR